MSLFTHFKGVLVTVSDTAKLIIRFGTIALGLILIIVFILGGIGKYDRYVETSGKYDLQIADLQKQLLIQKAQADEAALDVSATKSNVHSLNNVGFTVANIQNDLVYQLNKYESAQYGEIAALDVSVQDYLQQLSEYFDADEVRPWYQWINGSTVRPLWKCETNYDFYGTTFDVLWSCYNQGTQGERELLAVATATYNYETQKFSGLTVYVTASGVNMMVKTEDGE